MHDYVGMKAHDAVTGFSGIITGHADYLTGCDQFLIVPPVKEDGTKQEGCWFDAQRIVLNDASKMVLDNSVGNGADLPAPMK